MSVTKNSNTGYLHNLCSRGAVKEITKYLKESLSSANQLEERVGFLGYTPLHEATHRGHVSVVRLLLLYGANPNTTANGFYTCLHMAASMDNVECVKELIKYGAKIESQDEFGKTPYETAVIHRCKNTAKLLKSAEIKKMAKDNDSRLKETVRNLKADDISPTCLQEALEIACQRAHVNAINYIILADDKETLRLRDCIQITLRFNYVQALSVLLVCYAAQEGYIEMLGYLLDLPQTQQEKDTALKQLPHSQACHSHIKDIRNYLRDKEIFNVAVPIKIATHKKHKSATRILLLCTNCDKNSKQIDWRKLGLHEIDPSWLKDIKWAEKLYLLHNMLTTIPGNIIDLHKLCRLDLQNNQLQRIPSSLLKMNCLRTLNLSRNRLTELPKKCHWSPSLNNLDLSDNFLDSLPENMGRAKLGSLSIARNNFYDVPDCVCKILSLQRLDLSGNRNLRELPKEMGRLTEIYSLKLDNLDQVTDPPDEIKKNGTKTIMYLRAKLRSSKGYYSMKLMLVGRAAQGKTTLMHRLMLDYNYNLNSCTNGISMDEFRLRKDLFHKEYLFKAWDFGGQEDYYATHQCFLSTLSLYILVWNLEEGKEGIDRLEGWLDTISARAPRYSSFIIVGTHLDKIRKDKEKYDEEYVSRMHGLVEELQSQEKYANIDFKAIKEVSCAVDSKEGIEDLRITVYDAASAMLKTEGAHTVSVMGELIPHSYFLVEEFIQYKREELKSSNLLPIIHRADFEAIVTDTVKKDSIDVEDPNDIKDVTNFLNERGIIMHYNDPNQDLQDYYFLDPSWLCDLMARIVTLKEANPHIENGILYREKLQFIFKDERFPYDNYPQFVRLLNRFQIACSLDENRLLVPSKLPEEKPSKIVNISLPFVTIRRKHSLPFIPYGFWDRFIARFLYYTEDMLTSGCSRELGPGSPSALENHSPFLLDKICCKCPLVTKNGDSLFPSVSQEGVPISDDEEEMLDEVDNNDGFAGVYINGDDEGHHGGVWINGQWFGNAASGCRSDSDADYSTDEDEASSYGYGSQSGHYIPRVIRNKDAVYGRNVVKGRRKKSKRLDKNSQDPLSQSFNEAAFKSASRAASHHPSKSNSLPSSFPGDSFEDRSDSERGTPSSPSFGERSMTGMNGSFDDTSVVSETPEDSNQSRNIPTQKSSSASSFSSQSSSGFKEEHQSNHSYDETSLPDTDGQAGSFEHSDSLHGSISSDPFKQVDQSSFPTDVNGQVATNGDISNHRHSSSGVNQDIEAVNNDKNFKKSSSSLPLETQPFRQAENHEKNSNNVSKVDITSSNPLLPNIERYLNIEDTAESGVTGRLYPENQKTEYVAQASDNIVMASSNDVLGREKMIEEKRENPGNPESSFDEKEESFKLSQPTNFKKDELPVKQDRDSKRESRGSCFFEELVHSDTCPLHSDFCFDQLPDVPTDLSTLVDKKFLHCWRTGICLCHPKLFFSISTKPDPKEKGRALIETEVSPSRVGRRVLNYIVDHIDTLTREWYPDLSVSDGVGPKVRQYIPCVICERLGLRVNDFTFIECQKQSSVSDNISCPNHSGCDLNLHLVCPDIMLQDVDPELLLSKEEIIYNESESNLLGKGGFGKVVRGKCRKQLVAIKFFFQEDDTDPLKHYFEARKELNVLRRVRKHKYLISIVGVCLRPLCLVLELAEKGSLQASLFSSLVIHRIVLFRVAYQIADALSYLHSLGIIYRDLKPENVLVWSLDERDDLHVKLIDFGTANFATSTGLISCKGSLGTKAPEMLDLRKEGYTMQVDVYSYAILLYQMVLRRQPFLEIESEASVNAAVTRGERPRWRDSTLTRYGFPSLTELMLQSWVSKPTRRPIAKQIAHQVSMPPFQALLGKQPVPSPQSVRHACVVPDNKELWLGCYDHLSNKILVFDCNNLGLKHTFTLDGYQDKPCSFQVQAMHHVGELMLIAFRGLAVNILNAYSTSRYKLVWSIQLNEQATCIASDESNAYVGMNEGYVRCICKKDFKKQERKRNDHMIKVERHCVLSMVATGEKLWISSSKYIFTYFTQTAEMEAFDMESMWYGGPLGMEVKPQTQVSNLTLSFDRKSVWSTCRSVLTKWCVVKRQTLSTMDCAPVIQAISNSSSLQESDACIVCILPVLDTIWLGTAGGYILIFSSENLKPLTWFHPFGEVRTLSYCIGPGPCGTEQCFVISTGKNVRPEGFGTSNPLVCPLTPERLREVREEVSYKMAPKDAPPKARRRSTESRSTFYQPVSREFMFKCTMLVWEAFPANVFERMEGKSGRGPLVIKKDWHAQVPSRQ